MDHRSGYFHPLYAESLSEFGQPLELPLCKGWVLQRQIPGFPDDDAMGCYPLFVCQDWSKLDHDLEYLSEKLVSLALVTDPFGNYDEVYLKRCFQDVVIPFKLHYIVDLRIPIHQRISKNLRHNIHRALKDIQVEICQSSMEFLDEWVKLYDRAIKRFNIGSIRAFSRSAFARQLAIPGLLMYRAIHGEETVGIELVMVSGETAYGHLIAINDSGYNLGASDAIQWFVNQDLASRGCRWYDLGGTSGVSNSEHDGLKTYKLKWATQTRTAYFCGRIYNPQKYTEIREAMKIGETNYFPAYRMGEFA